MTLRAGVHRTALVTVGDAVRYRIPFGPDSYRTVNSSALAALTDASQEEIVRDINRWTHRGHLQVATAALGILAAVVVVVATQSAAYGLAAGLAAVAAFALARHVELERRQYALSYDLGDAAARRFAAASVGLERLSRCGWLGSTRVEHLHGDWKRNAGATITVNSTSATLRRGRLRQVTTNLAPAPFRLDAQNKRLWFLPDRLLIEENGRLAALAYDQCEIRHAVGTWRWHERLPSDAAVLRRVWHKVNRNGSPDRRFKGNGLVPVIAVGHLTLRSPTGLHLELATSDADAAAQAAGALAAFGRVLSPAPLCASAAMLAAADTWRDVNFDDFLELALSEEGERQGPAIQTLATYLSNWRDIFHQYDACTARSQSRLPPAEALAVVPLAAAQRKVLLKGAVVEALSSSLAALAAGSDLRGHLDRLVADPELILAFRSEDLPTTVVAARPPSVND